MRNSILFCDTWQFMPQFDSKALEKDYDFSKAETVDLPHTFSLAPYNYFDEKILTGTALYTRSLFLNDDQSGSKIFISFAGVLNTCELYVNGTLAASHVGETPFETEITDLVKFNYSNRIIVKADSVSSNNAPKANVLAFGGIHRNVSVIIEKGATVRDVLVYSASKKERRNIDKKNGVRGIEFDVKLDAFYPDISLSAVITDGANSTVGVIPPRQVFAATSRLKGFSEGVELWTPENPVLYTAKIMLISGEKVIDIFEIKFGFKDAEFKSGGFYLNSKPLKLIGLNRHDIFPVIGRASGGYLDALDARILRRGIGVNVVRTVGMPSKEFIDECDRIGLMVIASLPCEPSCGGSREWRDNVVNITKEVVNRLKNNASVIAVETRIGDTNDINELYFKTNRAAKEINPQIKTIGPRSFMASAMYEDVFGYNDYPLRKKFLKKPLTKLSSTAKLFVPYIITEHTGKLLPVKTFDSEKIRLEQALTHLRVIDAVLGSKKISGAIGMSFSDFYAASDGGSGNNICHYGVTDMSRTPKLSYHAYASQFKNAPVLKISSNFSPDEFDGTLTVFTNCDYIKVHRGENFVGDYYPDRKKFKHLPHPPVIVDDFVGALPLSDGFSPRQCRMLKWILKKKKENPFFSMKLLSRFKLFIIKKLLKIDADELTKLTEKYLLNPKKSEIIVIEGYTGGKSVIKKVSGPVGGKRLKLSGDSVIHATSAVELREVRIELTDDLDNRLQYDFSPVSISVYGSSVMLEGEKSFPLIGGAASFYIKASDEGQSEITVKCGLLTQKINVSVIFDENRDSVL